MLDPQPMSPQEATRAALHALWTFPSILFSAFLMAWAAEGAQFYISQGLALALLAWLQTLPEFAVEAVIAWHGDVPLMTANFTGALRLLTGVGWPMIWVVFAIFERRRGETRALPPIHLSREHAATVAGLAPPLLWFVWIVFKGTLDLVDAGVLLAMYFAYLALLQRIPPSEHEAEADAPRVVRAILAWPEPRRLLGVVALFLAGGVALFFVAPPFLDSMKGVAVTLGVSQFVFVQWVAPFLSEMPEKTSAFVWAKSRGKAGMALMNMASSNVNQWTVLAAMIPIVYSIAQGRPAAIPIAEHRVEIVLTLLQSALGVVLLANFRFHAHEALGLFALWFAQFVHPDWREEICWLYAAWLAFEIVSAAWRPGRLQAFAVLPQLWTEGARPRR
ncbi:MAG: sodium:calcium antiporter [Candidatus Eisenbacteria bacterium]